MNNIRYFLTHYPLSCTCIVVIWVVCMVPIPETPLSDVAMIDKWTHFVMYGGLCTVLWGEYGRNVARRYSDSKVGPGIQGGIKWQKALTGAFLCPAVMGGLIEICQATLTGGNRSGDVLDFVANSIGCCLGAVIGIPLALAFARRSKDS